MESTDVWMRRGFRTDGRIKTGGKNGKGESWEMTTEALTDGEVRKGQRRMKSRVQVTSS